MEIADDAPTRYILEIDLMMKSTMINQIVKYTNVTLDESSTNYSRGKQDCPNTTVNELMRFFRILYRLGVKKANHLNTEEMWLQDGTAPPFPEL